MNKIIKMDKALIFASSFLAVIALGVPYAGAQTKSAYPAGTNICGTNVGPWYPGMPLPSAYSGCLASAGTRPSGAGSSTATSTPGAPNTGAGGDAAANLAMLAASGMIGVLGAAYVLRTARAR
ncbi:MAG: hypothetical protein KGI45_01745 [Patescibacteria group bacterium]|nr:hypothetical protein [Patescibacteria group bacterium]MDE1941203.1 hypothetical protein [Patescibacteria group bacterium]MDE1966780.1 hypothetical protein [Patescibacteria group bacterium]